MRGLMLRGLGAFERFVEVEPEAVRLYLNHPTYLPGLLQVQSYAEEIIGRIAGLRPGDAELVERVNLRMQRAQAFRKRLEGPEPPQLWAVIDEAVLRRRVGGY